MKIESNFLNPITPQSKPEGVTPAGKGTHATNSAPKSSTAISEQARLLSKARMAANAASDVRVERVQDIKQRIVNGNYAIPYPAVARQLLEVMRGQKD